MVGRAACALFWRSFARVGGGRAALGERAG